MYEIKSGDKANNRNICTCWRVAHLINAIIIIAEKGHYKRQRKTMGNAT